MTAKYVFKTLADVEQLLDKSKPVAFDTETVGFYGRIRLAQFYQPHMDLPVLVEWPNPYELIALLNKIHFFCHNVHYDVSTCQEQVGKTPWVPPNYDCTLLLARLHFYDREGFGLDDCVRYVLNHDPYANNDQQESDWGVPILSEKQKEYAADDVVYLYKVYEVVSYQADNDCYKLNKHAMNYCFDFQWNGLPIDEARIMAEFESNTKRIDEIKLPINCNSYQQVRPYIGSQMSDDHGLAVLSAQGSQRAKDVRETRGLIKANSFLRKYLDTAVDGCIFGKFAPVAKSGRSTCKDQNLQQLPRDHKYMFGVEEGGDEVMIFTDFAAIQLRSVCAITGDTAMEALFRAGADLHNYVTEMVFGKDFTDDNRQVCKTGNFTLLFGAGAKRFVDELLDSAGFLMSEAEGLSFKKKWRALWKHIAAWQDRGIKDWKKGMAWQTPMGRKYTAKMMTDQLAIQIQGYEAEVAFLAMHYMVPKLKALHPSIRLRNFIHDSYIFTCVNDETIYKQACVIIADAMQEAWRQISQSVLIPDLPMPVKVLVGYNWGDMDKKKIFIYQHKQ